METILYFYKNREQNRELDGDWESFSQLPCRLERWVEDNYCLLRIGLFPSFLEWMEPERSLSVKENEAPPSFWKKGRSFLEQRRRARKSNALRIGQKRELEELTSAILPLADSFGECSFACPDALQKTGFWEQWKKYCSLPEFDSYREENWVRILLPYATYPNDIVLGTSHCLFRILYSRAAQRKSMQWILTKDEYKDKYQDWLDAIYENFGLAVDIHLLESKNEYKKLPLKSRGPVNVLDFTLEEKLSTAALPKECIWLDFCSVEEKGRRMEGRIPPVKYLSLKKLWSRGQKLPDCLDTVGKSGYNTEVN